MELQIYIAFCIATAIMIALPGPSVFLLISHSISFGGKRTLITVAGETSGIAVQLTLAAVGLTSLLNIISEAFEWLRWAGAAYIIYLGIKQWLSAGKPLEISQSSNSNKNLFGQGLIITILNPKSLIFIAAFLPQFIDTTRSLSVQFMIIVPTFLVITFIVAAAWALLVGNASDYLKNRKALKSLLRTAGGLMIVSGIGLALARRSN